MNNNPIHPVDDYAEKVGSGELATNKWVKLACLRHQRDVEKYGRNPSDGLWFSEKAAQDVIDFFPRFLQFYEGDFDGVPFTLTPSQAFIVGSIFGWKKGRFRRFKTAYIEQAKGQGKSPLAAGVGLFCLVADGESGAEVYSAAVTREQAGILFRDAKAFVEKSPSLRKRLNVGVANIAYTDTNSFFRPVSSERRGLDGKRPHVCLIDEIHEHPNDVVVRKMGAGRKTRRQPIIFEITNAGYDRESICYQHHEHTEKILEEIIQDDAWFGYMTGLDVCESCTKDGKTVPQDGCPNCDDWRDENVWIKANPNLPYLGEPFREYLRMQVEEAKSMAAQENIVKRLNFCIWTESITKWLPADSWSACAEHDLRIEDFAGQPCYYAFDLANKIDISALMLVFIRGDELVAFGRYYLPEDTIKRSKIQQYPQWVREKRIIATPGAMTDYKYIEDDIVLLNATYPIAELAFDSHEATYLVNNVMEWLGQERCIEFNQTPSLISEPMKQLEGLVYAGKIHHDGDPVLGWMISNVVLKPGRSGGPVKFYYPTKTNNDNKIDGAVALIMGVGRAMLGGGVKKSAYENLSVEEIKERMSL